MPNRPDPLAGYNIRVEIEGVIVAGFAECSGLRGETAVIEYREGGDHTTRKLPGLTKYSNIVLKRGLTVDRTLWTWYQTVVNGQVERRSGSIILLDAARQAVTRWNFFEAWPSKWEGPTLNAQANEVAIETIEIAHERLEWAD